jgi:hypothetical protein
MMATIHRKVPWLRLAGGVGICLLCGGFSIRQRPQFTLPTSDAWFAAKPACVFPLTSPTPPDSQETFMAALLGGLQRLARMPAGGSALSGEAIAYPSMRTLKIDLSNAVEDERHKPPKVNWHFVPQPGVHVDRLEVAARPLIIQGAKVQYDMTVGGAELKMAEDRARHPLLMLMGADEGHFSVAVEQGDVETLCLAAAKQIAGKYGFSVNGVSVELVTSTPRTVDAKLTVILGGRMGGTLHFTGRLTIADNLTATISHLSCHGQGVGGVMISSMLETGLLFYNGKTKPLVSFPFDGMQLRDVKFQMDAELRVEADFSKRA